jgi:hypothetical protein
MVIIDNKKDYYDYIVSIMGRDEKVVYDRRGSTVVGPSETYLFDLPIGYDLFFCDKPFKCDEQKRKKNLWQSCKYIARFAKRTFSWKEGKKESEEGSIYFLMLEVGYNRFIFELERYLDKDGNLKKDITLIEKTRVEKKDKKTDKPLYMCELYFGYGSKYKESMEITNPILSNTWIPRFIPAQDMWNMLYEYISSLNDKEFIDSRTNEQHIESHGFDKKISFRKRKV